MALRMRGRQLNNLKKVKMSRERGLGILWYIVNHGEEKCTVTLRYIAAACNKEPNMAIFCRELLCGVISPGSPAKRMMTHD